MRVVLISKAHVVAAYQTKLEALAQQPGIELTAITPPSWREPGVGELRLERRFTQGYRLEVLPLMLNGRHHVHFYRGLGSLLQQVRPEVLHIDEESFNLATFQAMRLGVALGARCCFFNWANIDRWYPPPFAFFERYCFRQARHAIAGNHEAAAILRRHSYQGPITILPQFGVDTELFAPPDEPPARPFVVGFIGRLLAAKGVEDLLAAVAGVPNACLRLIGDGELREALMQQAAARGMVGRVEHVPQVPSTEVPAQLRRLHALVLPSRTTPNWKEQFGRVLIEAMACGVPVIGSSSGEIPAVIGDAGLIFPEGDIAALRAAIQLLIDDEPFRRELGTHGRQRVLERYAQRALAAQYADVYRQMME